MSAAFGDALNKRELIDRDDPLAEIVARKIIEIARKGEHRPARLCSIALDADSGRSRPGFRHDAARLWIARSCSAGSHRVRSFGLSEGGIGCQQRGRDAPCARDCSAEVWER